MHYGYKDSSYYEQRIDDITYSAYFWLKENSTKNDDFLKIKKYAGKYSNGESVEDQIIIENISCIAYRNGSIIGYDTVENKSFIIYHPSNFSYIYKLWYTRPYLIAETSGKNGLIIINMETFYIKKYPNLRNFRDMKIGPTKLVVSCGEDIDGEWTWYDSLEIALPSH